MSKFCGKFLGDNDATTPILYCIRKRGHEGDCDNTRGDDEPVKLSPTLDTDTGIRIRLSDETLAELEYQLVKHAAEEDTDDVERLFREFREMRRVGPRRNKRQEIVHDWCKAAFSHEHATNVTQRGIRLLEEAIEAYQATGGTAEMAHKLVDYIFARPVGELGQELGGVGVTLLALAAAAGLSAEFEEAREVDRVLAKPLEHFAARNRIKDEAGFKVGK